MSLYNGLSIGLGCALLFTFFFTTYYSYSMYDFAEKYNIDVVVDYIVENYDKDEVVLYTGFNTGGYTEFRGLKSYIDGRAELFFKRFNGKEDIFDEAFSIESKIDFDFDKFLNKYKFTHIIVYDFSYFNMYLEECDDYKLVYDHSVSRTDEKIKFMLYVRKDLVVLK
jgi:hypothetical protein